MGDEQTRPSEDHIRRTRQLVAIMLPALREVARRNGYALAVHGSLERDIDIIAAPWHDGASDAESLIRGLLDACKSVLGYATGPGGWTEQEKFDPPVGSLPNPNRKPHGRLCWSIIVHGGLYFDVSVMPRADQKPPKDEEDRMTASQPPPRREPEEKSEPLGTYDCPLCGFDRPHTHDFRTVQWFEEAKANPAYNVDGQRSYLRTVAESQWRENERRAEFDADPSGVLERGSFKIDEGVRYGDPGYICGRDWWFHISPWIQQRMRALVAMSDHLAATLDAERAAHIDTKRDASQAWTEHLSGCAESLGHLEEDQLRCQLDASRAENAEMRRALEAAQDALEVAANALRCGRLPKCADKAGAEAERAQAALRADEKAPEATEPDDLEDPREVGYPPAPAAREPARLDAGRTAKPRTVLVAHANVEPGAMVAHDNEIERYELRDTGEPAPAADMPELVLRVEPNDDATLTCILCSYERPTELCTTYLSTHGTTTSGMHRSCYERARQKRSGAPPAAEGLTAEEWGVWNLTYGRWVGRESWHATREAAQRECDAWNRANGCEYEPRVRAAAEKAGGR